MENISKKIIINKDNLVADIQQAFNLFYPFLKIEFLKGGTGTVLFKNDMVNPVCSIRDITNLTNTATLNVEADRTVTEIKKECREVLGLSIQVFRKSGNVWNAISITDSWTLETQNKAGWYISTEMTAA